MNLIRQYNDFPDKLPFFNLRQRMEIPLQSNFDHLAIFLLRFITLRFGDIFYDENHGIPDNLHRFYGKVDKRLHHLPGILQDPDIAGLLFYGALPDPLSMWGWHWMIYFVNVYA
jgi:hypothetical protein